MTPLPKGSADDHDDLVADRFAVLFLRIPLGWD